ncbi:MAG: SPOR domain-containing protein [Cereibacter sphaeroides]|uniref:SPOR domain-containing protein n=1 Tax=Cereibacter sphaeroides TaxID=1063 RepID=A0A2W5SD65_CERSP|nr:MAG: SPOR domain-containing protein [Cereibacter sphaeroides]
MAGLASRHLATLLIATLALGGCVEGAGKSASTEADGATPSAQSKSVKLVDRDVEAPQVFQVTEQGLWDGRPSLGGVWVATPDAKDPERVIIRNTANGKFVIGALFRRERDNPGPKIQISSDAAEALGMLAGQPGQLNVTALRREEAPSDAPDASQPILDGPETVASETTVAEAAPEGKPAASDATLDTTAVAAAIDKADGTAPAAGAGDAATDMAAATQEPEPKKKWWQRKKKTDTAEPAAEMAADGAAIDTEALAATAPAAGAITSSALPSASALAAPAVAPAAAAASSAPKSGGKSLIQLGFFSVEENAKRAAEMVTKAGSPATVRKELGKGKIYWTVTAGPANTSAEREALMKKVKGLGFTDAYFVNG